MFQLFTSAEPERVEAKYSSDTVYEVAITLPSELKDLENLEYQITGESGEYGPRVSRKYKTTITDTRFDFRVERKARLCLNDLCGDGYAFAFTTNTGGTRLLRALKSRISSVRFAWKKLDGSESVVLRILPIFPLDFRTQRAYRALRRRRRDLSENNLE